MGHEHDLTRWLEARLLTVAGVEKRASRFGGTTGYFVEDTEFAHFHGPCELDVRLTRAVIKERRGLLASDSRVALGRADWVVIVVADRGDREAVLELTLAACDANRKRIRKTSP
jgi:hypothetical protein